MAFLRPNLYLQIVTLSPPPNINPWVHDYLSFECEVTVLIILFEILSLPAGITVTYLIFNSW